MSQKPKTVTFYIFCGTLLREKLSAKKYDGQVAPTTLDQTIFSK